MARTRGAGKLRTEQRVFHGGGRERRSFDGQSDDEFDATLICQSERNHSFLKSYGTCGDLEVRLARSDAEIKQAQRLRYQVFYREMSAVPDEKILQECRDTDHFDPVCEHLLVVDRSVADYADDLSLPPKERVVATCRLLLQATAENGNGFYSQREYDIASLVTSRGSGERILELGRSCVRESYRNTRTIELLWCGLWRYLRDNDVSAVIGCASFEGTDPEVHADALSVLHHHFSAPADWNVRAHAHLHVDMNMRPSHRLSVQRAMRSMPPLIGAYLRLGCFVGDGAVVDRQFGTTDVLMILPVERIAARYLAHFGERNEPETKRQAQQR